MRSNKFEVNIPVTMCIEVEAQENNCENKAYLLTDFKKSFAWLTSMKKLIFIITTVLDPGIFRSMRSKKWTKKMTGAKKS